MLRQPALRGFTLIELMVTLAILAILLVLGMRSYSTWIANSRIRTAAETLAEGLSAARNEAIRLNQTVRFQLVSDLSSSCALSSSGTSWVVSLNDPSSACDTAMSNTTAPFIVAKKSSAEQTTGVTIAATSSGGAGANTLIFNGVGRVVVTGTTPIAQINIDSSALSSTDSRDLRVTISTGGMIRMCDPNVTTAGDTRQC